MKSFGQFLMEAGGRPAGALEVHDTSAADAYAYAQKIFERNGKDIDEELPNFIQNYTIVQQMANRYGKYRRKDMPVLNSAIIEQFIKSTQGSLMTVSVGELRPVQKQMYFDRTIDKRGKGTLTTDKRFITTRTFVAARNFDLLDGHHRYLSGMLISPTLKVSVFRMSANTEQALEYALHYSDNIAKNTRNN
jgi:hypothetical protein